MSVPVVFLDSMLDQEVANRLATIITKHQVRQTDPFRLGLQLMIIMVTDYVSIIFHNYLYFSLSVVSPNLPKTLYLGLGYYTFVF